MHALPILGVQCQDAGPDLNISRTHEAYAFQSGCVCTHSVRRPPSPFNMLWCMFSSLLDVKISSLTPEAPSNVPSSMSVMRLLLRLLQRKEKWR